MECGEGNSDALNYINYLHEFISNIRPDDPLPVRAPCYKVSDSEIDGQIIDIVHHYLNKECPPYLRGVVSHEVWKTVKKTMQNELDQEDVVDCGNYIYDSMKLIQSVTTEANSLMTKLKETVTVQDVMQYPTYLPVSSYSIKNTRRKMEDRYIINRDLNATYNIDMGYPHALYGVFDGHGGCDAAVYSSAHLPQYLIQNPLYRDHPESALKHAFHITDTNFTKKAKTERLKGGTTAVVALLREKRLVVAWLGDSQATLVRQRKAIPIVDAHKPELQSEKTRIEDLGGGVFNVRGTWRVLGQLAVSRAIGDVEFKPFISSECDIKSLDIEGNEDFFILACDGLWDVLSPEISVDIIYAYLTVNGADTDGVGKCLVEAARLRGSEDNITAVVVFLRPVSILMEEEAARRMKGEVPLENTLPDFGYAKDSPPATIGAIFSPNNDHVQQSNGGPKHFDNAFNDNKPLFTLNAGEPPITATEYDLEQGLPISATDIADDFDTIAGLQRTSSDEGVAVDEDNDDDDGEEEIAKHKSVHDASTPTAEEVDAALAALDGAADNICEGDIEEEGEEEEDLDWAYYRMEPQTQPQGDDVLNTSEEKPIAESPKVASPVKESVELVNGGEAASLTNGDKSTPPGSPRSVEGFVTSVELNTPEENFGSLPVNQNAELSLEGTSGPFSVYVSTSPEPASLDSIVNVNSEEPAPAPMAAVTEPEFIPPQEESKVEIVHAQSTVEVVAPPSPVSLTETSFNVDAAEFIPSGMLPQSPVEDMVTVSGHRSPDPFADEKMDAEPVNIEVPQTFSPVPEISDSGSELASPVVPVTDHMSQIDEHPMEVDTLMSDVSPILKPDTLPLSDRIDSSLSNPVSENSLAPIEENPLSPDVIPEAQIIPSPVPADPCPIASSPIESVESPIVADIPPEVQQPIIPEPVIDSACVNTISNQPELMDSPIDMPAVPESLQSPAILTPTEPLSQELVQEELMQNNSFIPSPVQESENLADLASPTCDENNPLMNDLMTGSITGDAMFNAAFYPESNKMTNGVTHENGLADKPYEFTVTESELKAESPARIFITDQSPVEEKSPVAVPDLIQTNEEPAEQIIPEIEENIVPKVIEAVNGHDESPSEEVLLLNAVNEQQSAEAAIVEKATEVISPDVIPEVEEKVAKKTEKAPAKTTPAASTKKPTKPLSATKTSKTTPISKSTPATKKVVDEKKPAATKTLKSTTTTAKSTVSKTAPAKPAPKSTLTSRTTTTTKAAPKPTTTTTAKAPTRTTPTPKPAARTTPTTTKSATTAAPKPAARRPVPATRETKPAAAKPTSTTDGAAKKPIRKVLDKPTGAKSAVTSTDKTAKTSTLTRTTSATKTGTAAAKSTTTTTTRAPLKTRPTTTEKDAKNTTNKILSTTSRTTTARTSLTSRTTKTASASTTSSTTTSRTATTRTATKPAVSKTKTPTLKSSTDAKKPGTKTSTSATKKVPPKTTEASSEFETVITNGENKIVEEETTVEVKEKLVEDLVSVNSEEKQITEAMDKMNLSEQLVQNEVMVNGNDH